MGRYIAVGVISKIVIVKNSVKSSDITLEGVLSELNKELNINCYNFSEDQDKYYWEIKPEILEGNLLAFLTEQFKAYGNHEYVEKVLLRLTQAKSFSEIIAVALSKGLGDFQLIDKIISYIEIKKNGYSEYIDVYYSMISYFLVGKVIMEEYQELFRYLEVSIRLQRSKYPIVDCVKVMLTS